MLLPPSYQFSKTLYEGQVIRMGEAVAHISEP